MDGGLGGDYGAGAFVTSSVFDLLTRPFWDLDETVLDGRLSYSFRFSKVARAFWMEEL